MEENIGAADIGLSTEDLKEIEEAASKIAIKGARYSEAQQKLVGK